MTSPAPAPGGPPPEPTSPSLDTPLARVRRRAAQLSGSRTLSGRLALSGLAWISIWALSLLLAFNLLLSNVLSGQVDVTLRARAEAVAATIKVHGGSLDIATANDDALDTGTSIYWGTTVLEGANLNEELREHLVQRGSRTADGERFGPVRYLASPIMSHGRQVGTIVVSSDLTARTRTEWIVGSASAGLIALLLGFTFFALRATIRRAMRPVTVMGDQASAWSDQDIDRRFDPDAGPLELRHLARTLNALLERLSATLRHERRFTAELSHELRTPLAHLHAEVDLLAGAAGDPAHPEPVGPDDLTGLLTSIRRLEGLVESALTPVRLQSGSAGLGHLEDVLADLPMPVPITDSTSKLPAAPAISLVVTGDTDVTLAVESDVARRAVLPVLENAWRYAVREIRIDVRAQDGQVLIEIGDDGGRLDAAAVETAFEPGFRADPADGYPGAGLGLALSRRICRSVGGDVTAAVLPGRTVVTLRLPCLWTSPLAVAP